MNGENLENSRNEFRARYDEISVRQLVPDDIDKYAERALEDLTTLACDIREKHKWDSLTGKEWEDRAFEEEGIPDIQKKLEKIASEVDDLRAIDVRMNGLYEEDYPILPGDNNFEMPVPNSNPGKKEHSGSSTPGASKKTKTILFILSQAFGEDVSEDGPVGIKKGKKETNPQDPKWARQYYCIDAPNQNKYIFSCDKKNNSTFVVDKYDLANLVDENGQPIDIDKLQKMKKSKVSKLIKTMPNSKRIIFRQNFADNVKRAIMNRPLVEDDIPPTESCYV